MKVFRKLTSDVFRLFRRRTYPTLLLKQPSVSSSVPVLPWRRNTTTASVLVCHFSSFQVTPMTGTMADPKTLVTESPNLSSVVLRYHSGDERFQLSITIKTRKFNFDRSVTESTAAFLEKVKFNIAKKVKNFEPEKTGIVLMIGSKEYASTHSDPFPLAEIIAGTEPVMFRLGEEEIAVDFNPPEVTSIKFLKQALVGFPLLPLKMEGSPNFNASASEFLWESRPGEAEEEGAKGKRPKVRKPSKEIWTRKNPGGSLVFTPAESDANSHLRFTCFPSNGERIGLPLTVELSHKVSRPLVENFLFKERLKVMESLPKSPSVFRVISYNALSEMLTTPEWFKASPKESLETDYRLPLLNAEFRAYQGDILCLQEVERKHFERYFAPFLWSECGLRGCLSLKSGEEAYEGLATFYNPSKFTLLETETVVIRDEMKKLSFYDTLATVVPGLIERLEDRNTVLQVSVFQHSNDSHIFIVANTHLYFKPDADHIRLLQTITSLSYLGRKLELVKASQSKPVTLLFCGDFNCTPPFGSYRFALSGKVTEDDEDWTSHENEKIPGISFQHSLNLSTAFPAEELTTIVANFEGCIDYIFFQPSILRLLQAYPPPSKAQIAELVGLPVDQVSLPNFLAPSDHLPIIADFSLEMA